MFYNIANSVDRDQTDPEQIYTVCISITVITVDVQSLRGITVNEHTSYRLHVPIFAFFSFVTSDTHPEKETINTA